MVDSQQEELDIQTIVSIALKETDSGYPFDQAYPAILKELTMPECILLRYGNTLYIVHRTDPRTGFFRALNADTPQNYLESGFAFVETTYNAGFDTLVTEFKGSSILNIFRAVSKNPPQEGMGFAVQKGQDDTYRVTLQLGTPRG
jgi:hypothetical protein